MMTKRRYQQPAATIKKPASDRRLRKLLSTISYTIYIWELISATRTARNAQFSFIFGDTAP